ncbi:MAG: rhodanese-like domain-containing protein [Nitrospirota bacterium]
MAISNYFKPVKSMSADKVREYLRDENPDEYNLIDVRQPFEYEQDHIPGAHLMPLKDLSAQVKNLDREKPTIAY